MTFENYTEKFLNAAKASGMSAGNISKCLAYAKQLSENNCPIIYNLTHLSKLVGYERKYVGQAALVSKHSDSYYRYYKIPKKNGETREIKEPLPNLKNIQYWILNNILEKQKPSSYAKAYVKKRGLKQNIRFHKGQKKVVTVDLEDFFPSIKYETIEDLFIELGYSLALSSYLAKLCCLEGKLPQGAPTSPYLSNLVFYELDEEIAKYCMPKRIRFTRYADDLTFSGDFSHDELFTFLDDLFKDTEFSINARKTKIMLSNERQIVTGVVVNEKPQLDRSKRRKLRQEMFYIDKFGLKSHLEKTNIGERNYLLKMLGIVNFGLYLNPSDKELVEHKTKLLAYIKHGA